MVVVPMRRWNCCSSSRAEARSLASRFESGSSSRNTSGSRTTARARATRWRSPPESCRGLRSSSRSIPKSAAAHWTFFGILRARGGRSLTTCPPIRISPAVGRSSPAIIRSRVVFPHPDGPRRTRNSPSLVDRSTPSTARTSPNCLLTPLASTLATAALDQPLLLPLAEDPLAGDVGFLEGLLGRLRAGGRLREHDVQHPGAEDLVDGRVGVARVTYVGRPVQHVVQYLVLVGRVGLRIAGDQVAEVRHRLG